MDIRDNSARFRSAIRTDSASGRSRVPSQARQGRLETKREYQRRARSEFVSRIRRVSWCITPSHRSSLR